MCKYEQFTARKCWLAHLTGKMCRGKACRRHLWPQLLLLLGLLLKELVLPPLRLHVQLVNMLLMQLALHRPDKTACVDCA